MDATWDQVHKFSAKLFQLVRARDEILKLRFLVRGLVLNKKQVIRSDYFEGPQFLSPRSWLRSGVKRNQERSTSRLLVLGCVL